MVPVMRRTAVLFITYIVVLSGLVLVNDWTTESCLSASIFHRGDSSTDEVWEAEHLHYVDDEYNVTWNTTLTIEAGARVFVDNSNINGKIVVDGGGRLIIEGTEEAPVFITANTTSPGPGDYTGIEVRNGGTAYINHTYIGNATIGIDIKGANVEVNNCVINESLEWGIYISGSGSPRIANTTINNTGDGGVHSGGLYIGSNCVISDCQIFDSNKTGIYIGGGSPTVENTNIHDTVGNGVRIRSKAIPRIINSTVSDTGSDNIYVTGDTRTIAMENCTLGNRTPTGQGATVWIENTDASHMIGLDLINTTCLNETFNVEEYGNLTVKWHMNVDVEDGMGSPIEGANVSLLDSSLEMRDWKLTDHLGRAHHLLGIEYIYNSTGFIYDRNYTVQANYTGCEVAGRDIWLNGFNNTTLSLNDIGPPAANAGQDQTVDQGDTVTFDGNGSTDNIGIANYTWTFNDSGPVILHSARPTHRFNYAGMYNITLNVTDEMGNWGLDSVVVTVNDVDKPTAHAGEDLNVGQGDTVFFNGTGSIDNVGIANYTWTLFDSGVRILYGVSPNYTFDDAEVYAVTLEVFDEAGNSDTDTVNITVNDTEEPQTDAGPNRTIDQGGNIELNGSGSSDNVVIDNYTWTLFDMVAYEMYGVAINYTFHNAGVFNLTLTATDPSGNQGVDTVTITVNDTTDPTADAGPDMEDDQGEIITFMGNGSFDNVGVHNYTWTFNDSGAKVLYGASPNYSFSDAGSYLITLNVTDAAGNWGTDIFNVTVNDITDPMAVAGKDIEIMKGELASFNGNGSSDNVGIVNYTWYFMENGSNNTLQGMTSSYRFQLPGSYEVWLRVEDGAGNIGLDNLTVTVRNKTAGDDDEDDDNVTKSKKKKEGDSYIWLWVLIIAILGIVAGGIYFHFDREKKIREGRKIDEMEINRITGGRMDFIILRKHGTKRFKKYELHRIQGVAGDVAGIFWDTSRDSSWVLDRMVTGSREMVASKFEYDIKKNLDKGYSLDYFGTGLIIRLLGKGIR